MQRPAWCITLSLLLAFASGVCAQPEFVETIDSVEDFEAVSIQEPGEGRQRRTTKFLLPARDDPGLLPPLFQNTRLHLFHREFLARVFPDRFPKLSPGEYEALVEARASRSYFAGFLSLWDTPDGEFYGFGVFTKSGDVSELLEPSELLPIYETLSGIFAPRPLRYAPITRDAIERAKSWDDPGFPVYTGGATDSDYVAYTQAIGYGRVRRMTLAEFEEANESGLVTWRDILVLERAPSDIEGVVSGVITGEPQSGALSHIAIRTARRGTPNAFVNGALDSFAEFDGELVRLEVRRAEYRVRTATQGEAESWWSEHRPSLSSEPTIDEAYGEFDALLEMDVSDSGAAVARFGGKAVNFARLQQGVFSGAFESWREVGFGIPARYYLEFMRENRIDVGGEAKTYEEHLLDLFEDETFESDSRTRFEALAAFREHAREHGEVSFSLVARLAARIDEVFGETIVPVRFRSSSNVEDQLEFNGAGLYESTTACAADSFDADDRGPSRCNRLEPDERGIERALKKVWTSLWTFRAFEERSWYQVPQESTAMAVLVSRAFIGEAANGVAFTGNPASRRDGRALVTSQLGEVSVVHPEPGVIPESSFLEFDARGEVVRIDRAQASSLSPAGEHVLSDDELRELGRAIWRIDETMPVELGEHAREDVLFDIEFKLESGGELAIKQVRPFLMAEPPFESPAFQLEIPAGVTACGQFTDSGTLAGEYAVKSRVAFRAGTHELPTDADVFTLDLVDSLVFGPDAAPATASGAGRVELDIVTREHAPTSYHFAYSQPFELAGGSGFELSITFRIDAEDGEPPPALVFDDALLTHDVVMSGAPSDASGVVLYTSCELATLPLWDIRAELTDGTSLRLEERFRQAASGSAPALLKAATVRLGGVERRIEDYFDLVYDAQHHNERVRWWVVLDPPVDVPGAGAVHVVELHEEVELVDAREPALARYLDEEFREIAAPAVTFFWRGHFGEEPPLGFRRGDSNTDGRINLTDAIEILNALFLAGPAIACPDAADFNDDGSVEMSDAIFILSWLFRGVDIVHPPGPYECGEDPTNDFLEDCEYNACEG